MANPFSALGSIPIMQTITGLMQQQADVNRTNAQTQIIGQQSQMLAQEIESERKFNEGLAQLANVQQAKDRSEAGFTTSPDFAAFGNTSMGKPIIEGYQSEIQSADRYRTMAKVALNAGAYARSEQLQKQADDSSNRARQWYMQGLQLFRDQQKEAASLAGSYNPDGSNLDQVVDGMNDLDPRALQGPQFDRNLDGSIKAGDRTTAAFANVANQKMTRSEQIRAKQETDRLKSEAVKEDQNERRLAQNDRRLDQMLAAQQSSAARADAREARAERKEARENEPIESDPGTAAMIASGMPLSQAVPGYGTAAVNERKARRKEAIQQIMDETGMDKKSAGQELANRQIGYVAGRRSTTQLTTMRGATEQAVAQLDFNIDKTTEEMKKLPSTNLSPLLNSIIRGEERWTGDPAYASLYFYMHAAAMESARILQGGQASIAQLHQGAAEEAKHWADIGLTPAMWGSVSKAMHDEGVARMKTYDQAIASQKIGASHAAEARGVPGVPQAGDVVKGYKFKGGDPSKQENWEKQ